MTLRHWTNSIRRDSKAFCGRRRPNVSARGGARPGVELLENRTLLSVNLTLGFKGLDTNDAGGIVEPPDTIAAAGPTAIVELVNSNIAFYDKTTGQSLFSEGLDVFFAPVDPDPFLLSDVSVTYDEQAGRFFVSSMNVNFNNLVSYFDFAVSNDSNPLDGFTEMHRIDTTEVSPRTGETLFTDFPRLGWNADAYVLSFNMFGFNTESQYNSQLLTIQKSTVLDKNTATLTDYQVDRPLPNSTIVPATMHGSSAGGPMWLVEEKGLEQDGSYQSLRVVKMTNLLSASPTFTDYYVTVAPYTITPFPGDTLGTVSTALDTRILNLDWRNNQMVAAQNVGIASDTNVHARWYEISTAGTAPSLVQQGTLNAGAGNDTYMPSVALGTDGGIGMTYMESSPDEDMSMYVTGRATTDPTGTMQAPVLAKAGEQYYQGTRIGDFSGITVDPTNGTTYWAANEYSIATSDLALPNWGTWIAKFNITAAQPTTTSTQTIAPPASQSSSSSHTATRNVAGTVPGAQILAGGDLGWSRGRALLAVPPADSGVNRRGSGSGTGAGDPQAGGKNPTNVHGVAVGTAAPPGGRTHGGGPLVVTAGFGFKGLDTNDAGGIVEPPDTIAAAGPTAIVELVNSNIAFYDKTTGQSLFSEGLDVFFAPVDPDPFLLSDVSVTYDEQAGRFFVSSMNIDFNNLVSYFDFAVSNDSNPLDGFTEMHRIDTTEVSPRTDETLFTDFPRLGWNADAYVLSFNMFGFNTESQYNTQLLTIQKLTVLDENTATLTDYQVDRPLPNSTIVPATMHGSSAGGPLWLVEEKGLEQDGSYQSLRVVKMTNLLSASPTFTDYYVTVAPYTITPFPGDTLGTVSTALDTRILNLDWRNNQMVAAQDVGIASDTNVHARWYEISTAGTAPSLVQQGTLNAGAGNDTYMPSVALGTDGGIGMTYIESSPDEDMSMYVTGRATTDPTGTMQAPVLAKAGEQYYQGTRIGDFSGITVDPTNGTTYWAANEYSIATSDLALPNWGTWIAKFQVTPLQASIADPGFEQVQVGAGKFQYRPTGSPWTFSGNSGISANNSGFTSGNPPAPEGTQVAFLQGMGSFTQTVTGWAAGSYVLTFDAAQCGNYQASKQDFEVLVNGTLISKFTPSGTSYGSYTTASFTVTAGSHTIKFLGLDTAGGDNTAFVNAVTLATSSSIADPGFEQVQVGAGKFQYRPTGSPWTFTGNSGISANNSGFTSGNPPAPEGTQVAFLQGTGSFTQTVTGWSAGSYVLTFDAAQRGNYQASKQDFEVLVNGTLISKFTPSGTSYGSYTTASFTVTAGSHTIKFLGLDTAGGDNTAFVDAVALAATASIADPGFEQVQVGAGKFQYRPTGSPWTFSGNSGISANNSGFTSGNPPAPEGTQVAFLQGMGSFTQTVTGWAAGSYVLTFDAAQRGNYQASKQDFEVLVDGTLISKFTPSGTSYGSYTTATFTVTAGSHTIKFLGLDTAGGDNTAFVNAVAIQ